jgi:hypothetical protein
MFCQKCGQANDEEAKFCKSCGAPLGLLEESPKNNSTPEEKRNHDEMLLEAFIGKPKKVAYYANAFKKFEIEGKNWNWSWWAAIFNLMFLFHRKIYLPAIIVTLILTVSDMVELLNPTNIFLTILSIVFNIGVIILLGGYGIKLVHNNFQKMKNEITTRVSDKELQIQEMRKQGGFIPVWKLIVGYALAFIATYAIMVQIKIIKPSIACDGGDAYGCYNLGRMYYYGEGVQEDYFKAVELFTKACDGGYARGCKNLGDMYENGEGVRQDYSKAVELFTKACDMGNAGGCNSLGLMYEFGKGVRQDYEQALKYYGKACDMKSEMGCKDYARLKKISSNSF